MEVSGQEGRRPRFFVLEHTGDEYACRNIYYYCMVVKIQGIVVKNDSLYLNGMGYNSRLPYYKNDFEKLKMESGLTYIIDLWKISL